MIPAGRPKSRTAELDAIRRRVLWNPPLVDELGHPISVSPRERTATLTAADVLAVLAFLHEQSTWARALEAAVRWRK